MLLFETKEKREKKRCEYLTYSIKYLKILTKKKRHSFYTYIKHQVISITIFYRMTESPLNIPVYEGSMMSLRSTTPSMARLRPMTGLAKR